MSMKTKLTCMMMALALAAGTRSSAQDDKGLQVEITPYLWLAGIEGDATVNGQKTDFEKKFSDIVDAVDVAGSLLAVVQVNRFLVWGQVDYFSTDTDKMDVEDQPQGGRLETDMTLLEFAVGYQFDGWMEDQTFDVLVGVRHLEMDNTLTVKGDGTVHEKTVELTDPMLVVRPSMAMFPSKIDGLRFNPTLAIGGGGDSEMVYELFPQIQYQISELAALRVGYRTVGYKFEGDNNDNELNINLAGLIVGLGMTF
jgi:hypothetical protein